MSNAELEDWCDQYRAEVEKMASSRAATIEGLLLVGDYQACRDWLDQWEEEDKSDESPAYKYNQAKTLLRLSRRNTGANPGGQANGRNQVIERA